MSGGGRDKNKFCVQKDTLIEMKFYEDGYSNAKILKEIITFPTSESGRAAPSHGCISDALKVS